MDRELYTKICGLIDSIQSNINLYEVFAETNPDTAEKILIEARDSARGLFALGQKIGTELELCFANNGEDVFVKFCLLIKDKFKEAAFGAPAQNIGTPIFFKDWEHITRGGEIMKALLLKLRYEVLIFDTRYKQGGVEADVLTDINYVSFFSFGVLYTGFLDIRNKEKSLIKPKQLLGLMEDTEEEDLNFQSPLLYPKKIAHKVILLNKLGIVEKLKESLPNSDNTTLTKLLAVVLNIKEKQEIETLRKALSDLHIQSFNTPTAISKVNTILTQFGINLE